MKRQANDRVLRDCPICLDALHNTGNHRIVSLNCGHLFGHHCIRHWLNNNTTCPKCKKAAKTKQIREIYTSEFEVADVSKEKAALDKLTKEQIQRRALEAENQSLNNRVHILSQQVKVLQRRCNSLTEGGGLACSNLKAPGLQLQSMWDFEGGRVCAIGSSGESIVVSGVKQSSGFYKLNSHDVHRHSEFISCHGSASIRDIRFGGDSEQFVLTGSLDKSVQVTSLRTDSKVLGYSCSHPVWSCCWDSSSMLVFSGLLNGTVVAFDTRNTSEALTVIDIPLSTGVKARRPIHSLQYAPSSSVFPSGGLVVGAFNSCHVVEPNASWDDWSVSFVGEASDDLLYDQSTSYLSLGTRGTDACRQVLELSREDDTLVANELGRLEGYYHTTNLCRGGIGRLRSESVLACPSERSNNVYIYNLKTFDYVQKLDSHPSPVLDVKFAEKAPACVSVSDKQLHIHKCKNQ